MKKLFTFIFSLLASFAFAQEWQGTGFALNKGYVVTNYHVTKGAGCIKVRGVKGDFTRTYTAAVIKEDKVNDLALLKINDASFTGFGTVPYRFRTNICDVAEDIFVLGYPETGILGDEIKYTEGTISSLSGFQGDVTKYQISASVTHGNSGGPAFDKYGNVVGIVNSGITDKSIAENVGYAIKVPYLKTLIESVGAASAIPTQSSVANLSKTEKVKLIKKFVFMIECSSSYCPQSAPSVARNTQGTSTVVQSGFVDLGLSVKWAKCNLGASKPEQYGNYYAWGETSTKSLYTESNSTTYGKSLATLKSSGIVDANGNLTANYDVAQKLGKGRMPTFAEIKELKERCKWTWTSQSGVNGYKVTGPNGNSIFLPAAGDRSGSSSYNVGSLGDYWSSTAYDDSYNAYDLGFGSRSYVWGYDYRDDGRSVRPVMDK